VGHAAQPAPTPLPTRRTTINFIYPEMKPDRKSWWLVIDGEKVDLCLTDPGYDVDLYVSCPLRTMTAVWMGMAKLNSEVEAGHIQLTGDRALAKIDAAVGLGLSPFRARPARGGIVVPAKGDP